MNKNLPQVKQEGVFEKIKKWFLNFLRGQGKRQFKIQNTLNESEIEKDQINKSNFAKDIKVEQRINMLQRKIKENQIKISDLTDKELDEMKKI